MYLLTVYNIHSRNFLNKMNMPNRCDVSAGILRHTYIHTYYTQPAQGVTARAPSGMAYIKSTDVYDERRSSTK